MFKRIDDISNSQNHSIPVSWEELDSDNNIYSTRTLSQSAYIIHDITTPRVLDERTGFMPKVRILKREEQSNAISNVSHSSVGTTISIDEKQRRYDQARKKIFEQGES